MVGIAGTFKTGTILSCGHFDDENGRTYFITIVGGGEFLYFSSDGTIDVGRIKKPEKPDLDKKNELKDLWVRMAMIDPNFVENFRLCFHIGEVDWEKMTWSKG